MTPILDLNGPLLFGLEKESPVDLHNIFYRSARYCIYSGRKKYAIPSVEYLKSLVRDELKYKYSGNKILEYLNSFNDGDEEYLKEMVGYLIRGWQLNL